MYTSPNTSVLSRLSGAFFFPLTFTFTDVKQRVSVALFSKDHRVYSYLGTHNCRSRSSLFTCCPSLAASIASRGFVIVIAKTEFDGVIKEFYGQQKSTYFRGSEGRRAPCNRPRRCRGDCIFNGDIDGSAIMGNCSSHIAHVAASTASDEILGLGGGARFCNRGDASSIQSR